MPELPSRLLRLTLLSAIALLSACQPPGETNLSGSSQGTTWHLKYFQPEPAIGEEILRADIEAVLERVDQHLSNWRDDSEISRFNQSRTTEWQSVSPEIVLLTALARQVHEETGGCYDLTIKPLLELWGFSSHEEKIPGDAEIQSALAHVGMEKLEIDTRGRRLRKVDPEVRIGLDSIAQGYTVSLIAQLLENHGIKNYLAEVGGEMKVRGRKADGTPWRIAVEKPTPMVQEVQRMLDLNEAEGTAVMTSGTYRNFFESDGQQYSHIIDPRTGRPVRHRLLSTTVLHEDPTLADAWSTALLCLGEREGAEAATHQKLKALLIYRQGDELREWTSPAFSERPQPEPAP